MLSPDVGKTEFIKRAEHSIRDTIFTMKNLNHLVLLAIVPCLILLIPVKVKAQPSSKIPSGTQQLSLLNDSQTKAFSHTINDSLYDGPYIFYANDSITAIIISNGILHKYSLSPANFTSTKASLNLQSGYHDLLEVFTVKPDYAQKFKAADSIAAISDVHGQYDIYIRQLKANGIIDENLDWNFGKGHFVFLGDMFDRGDKVTEIVWHLFNLEKQAAKAGGTVHVILGNHESMIFDADLRYISEKYKKAEAITGMSYLDLYSQNSVLGKWLRSQPVMVSINDIVFVHGGASIELVRQKLSIKEINRLFYTNILGQIEPTPNEIEKIDVLTGNNGPLWYRGYFEDTTFGEPRLDSILNFYNTKHIVVGHTTHKSIQNKFNDRIIGIDAGIGYGNEGELLIIKNGEFYKGSGSGERTKL